MVHFSDIGSEKLINFRPFFFDFQFVAGRIRVWNPEISTAGPNRPEDSFGPDRYGQKIRRAGQSFNSLVELNRPEIT